jgi:hypothetical protein
MPDGWTTAPTDVTAMRIPPWEAGPSPATAWHGTPADEPPGQGGDPACWLNLACTTCGRMSENKLAARCSRCGATLSTD